MPKALTVKKPRRKTRSIGKMLGLLKAGSDVRANKVRRVKGAVRAKRYENDLKLSIAVERILTEL